MYCKQCGTDNPDNVQFCRGCGTPLAGGGVQQPVIIDSNQTTITFKHDTAALVLAICSFCFYMLPFELFHFVSTICAILALIFGYQSLYAGLYQKQQLSLKQAAALILCIFVLVMGIAAAMATTVNSGGSSSGGILNLLNGLGSFL